MRPRFKAGSIRWIGSKTWALTRLDCMISSRNPSGHCSDRAFNGAVMAADSTGLGAGSGGSAAGGNGAAGGGKGAAAAGGGVTGVTGANGLIRPLPLRLPLLRGAMKLVVCEVSNDVRDGGGGATTLGVGVTTRGTNAGGGGATGVGSLATGTAGATMRNGGLPPADVRDVNVVDGVGLVLAEILTPCAPGPNGPLISSATSRCFWTGRRDSLAGFSRVRISLSGRVTVLESCSPPELTNIPGAACRNSPKVILTEPNAN